MNSLLDRFRSTWDALNDRERRLFSAMLVVLCGFVLGFPLFWTARENAEIESDNAELRKVLALLAERRPELEQLAEARKSASKRYLRKAGPLGTFLEDEAGKQGLTIKEVNDQPEKTVGAYRRRSVTASINDAGLTGIINLLSAIASSDKPVAVESIQLEHYQPGDTYRVKVGVVAFDRTEPSGSGGAKTADKAEPPSEG
jgi:Type II secretion system (T2SS), protein M